MININKLAPVIIFTYNRPKHIQQTIQALQKNHLAENSEVFIYSDGAKNDKSRTNVNLVRNYLKTINGFKTITIIERNKNWGLANNIINGVTDIINKYGNAIVLEDDLVTSPYFLDFMNKALDFYIDKKQIWHISAWVYPTNLIQKNYNQDVFLWRMMNCCGWATWRDRWRYFEKIPDKLINNFSKKDIHKFNLDGISNHWNQVLDNRNHILNTWAIFWYATIFKQNGLCLNPTISYLSNIGHDGSGTHCQDSNYTDNLILNNNPNPKFIDLMVEDTQIVNIIKKWHLNQQKRMTNILPRIINKISRIVYKKNIIK